MLNNSDSLVQALRMGVPGVNFAMSIDIEELFYSVPHDELFVSVREDIDSYGVLHFQNECLITVESFIELLA